MIGAGIMGSGIALACAKGGHDVSIWDVEEKATQNALANIRSALGTLVETNIVPEQKSESVLKRIAPFQEMREAVRDAELVFEVVPEQIELKRRVLRKLDAACRSDTILASNTSTFKIGVLASATKRPGKVIGTHWMNPAYLLPLVEVTPSTKTSSDTRDRVKNLLTSIGKHPILCKDTPGFLVNRMNSALLVEAISIVQEGIATMEDVDMAWTQHLGPRYCIVGPFQLMDSFGLDTEHSQYSYLQKTTKDNKFKPPTLLKSKVRKHQLGLKTGKGFFDYSGKDTNSIVKERDRRFIELLRFLRI